MVEKRIEKRSDPTVRYLRQVRDGAIKTDLFCEGLKLVEELFASSLPVKGLYCLEKYSDNVENLKKMYSGDRVPVKKMTESVMKFVSDMTSPPGIVAVGQRPASLNGNTWANQSKPLILIVHQIQLPQNVGALLRSAEATGVTEVWLTNSTVDPYSPKALRGAMGSAFRIPIRSGLELHASLKLLDSQGVHVVGATQDGKKAYHRVNWKKPIALVMGSEGSGFRIEEMKYMKDTICVPMQGKVESLNVGTAAAVCLFEAQRQREGSKK